MPALSRLSILTAGLPLLSMSWPGVLASLALPAWLLGAVLRIFAPALWLALVCLAAGVLACLVVLLCWPPPARDGQGGGGGEGGGGGLRLGLALVLLCLPLLLLPVADPLLRGAEAGEAADPTRARPVYGFREAHGNPHAFNAWWTQYFNAWQEVQPLVEQKDPAGLLRAMPIPGARAPLLWGEVVVNNLGFRGRDIPAQKGRDFRIVTLGASPTFGQNVFAESRPWSLVLEELIDARYACRRPVQVINAGVNGYRITDSINRLRRDIAPLQPDLVLSYHGYNGMEFIDSDLPEMAAPTLPPADAGAVTQAWLRLDFFLRSAAAQARALPQVVASELIGQAALGDVEVLRDSAYYRHYETLVETAADLDADLALATFSMAVDARSPPEVLRFYAIVFHNNLPGLSWMQRAVAGMEAHNRIVEDLGRRHPRVQVLDTRPGLDGEFDKDLFIDIVHFTPAGDRKMAENLLAGLEGYLIGHPELACRPK